MKNKTANFTKILYVVLIFIFLFSGCGQKQQKSSPQQLSTESEQSTEKAPEQLKRIEESIEKIIKELKGPAVEIEEKKSEQNQSGTSNEGTKSQGKGQSKQSTMSQGKGQSSQSTTSQSTGESGGTQKASTKTESTGNQNTQSNQGTTQAQPTKTTEKQDPWKKITPLISNLHYMWNSYMPMATKKGATNILLDNFSNALNSLTDTIITKNDINTLLAANKVYSYIPELYSLYKTETSPQVKVIRYYTRSAILYTMTANWAQTDKDMDNLKSAWSLFKNMIPKEQQNLSSTLDLSIIELDKVIKARNQTLTYIKGGITLSNIAALEKAGEEKTGQGGEKSGEQKGGGTSGGQTGGGQ